MIPLILSLVLAAPGANDAACSGAHDLQSRLICADPDLRRLDTEMRGLIARVRAETSGVDGETGRPTDSIGAEQDRWNHRVAARCRDGACLVTVYRQRIADIRKHWAEALS
jgi:uncharacterized protein